MYYLYSTNDKPGAKLIRWGGRDKASHFAKYYPGKNIVIEARLDTGVREISFTEWKKENRVIYAQEINFPGVTDHDFYLRDRAIIGKRYDSKAVFFLALVTLWKRFCSWFPYTENKWGEKDAYFCLEIMETHKEIFEANYIPMDYDLENLYPQEFYEILIEYPSVNYVNPEVFR
jgi:hypothetical protein